MTERDRDKLLNQKASWAREGRLLTGKTAVRGADRLPPGQHLVRNWPVLDLGIQPEVPRSQWLLTVDGLVARPLSWNWSDFLAEPQSDSQSDIHCVTAWSRYDNHWRGVTARRILERVQPLAEARHLIFHSYDNYTTNLRLELFAEQNVLLAHSWEGEYLTREHGGPVRVVVPNYYFWKSAKWLKRIEVVAEDRPGYWENRNYHNVGDPWREQRYG
ncbi:MAG: sulfite oxidase-like oxidoreductase [Alphaproteobacteria bacterium]|nr:sulfite oxidase-like oxidoreductase [Alphaproteobacteria bacterium]